MTEFPHKHTFKAGQQIALKNGMGIKMSDSSPDFLISINPQTNAITFITSDAKVISDAKVFTFNPGKHPIGRESHNAWQILYSDVSRSHGVLFHAGDKGWRYAHEGKNSGRVKSQEPIEVYGLDAPPLPRNVKNAGMAAIPRNTVDDDVNVETVTNPLRDQENPGPFPITDGMQFQFHPHLPTYTAEIKRGKLTLISNDPSNTRMPATIEIDRHNPKIFGRNLSSNVILHHTELSNKHAEIGWDASENGYMYTPLGKIPPTILLAPVMKEIDHLPPFSLPPQAAAAQLDELNALIAKAEVYAGEMSIVQHFEEATIVAPLHRPDGWNTEDAQAGYNMWLRVYEMLYREQLQPDESRALLTAAERIEVIGKDRAELRDIENYERPQGGWGNAKLEAVFDNSPRDNEVKEYIAGKVAQFEKEGRVFLPSGCRGHHAIAQMRVENGERLVTIYNAGLFAREAGPDRVYGTEEHRMQASASPELMLRILTEQKLIAGLYSPFTLALDEAFKNMTHPEIVHGHIVSPQHKGNCTTRSTREMLRDTLPPQLFENLHHLVSDPNKLSADDMLDALHAKRDKFMHIAGVSKAGASPIQEDKDRGLNGIKGAPREPESSASMPRGKF